MQCGAGDETILFLLHRNRFWLLGFSANCADLHRPSGISTEPLLRKQQKSKSNFLCLSSNNKPQTIQVERAIMCSCRTHRLCFVFFFYFYHSSFTYFIFHPFIISFQNITTCQKHSCRCARSIYVFPFWQRRMNWPPIHSGRSKSLVRYTLGTLVLCPSCGQTCIYRNTQDYLFIYR